MIMHTVRAKHYLFPTSAWQWLLIGDLVVSVLHENAIILPPTKCYFRDERGGTL